MSVRNSSHVAENMSYKLSISTLENKTLFKYSFSLMQESTYKTLWKRDVDYFGR
jgi:hypothetical protein